MKALEVSLLKQLLASIVCSIGIVIAGTSLGWASPTVMKIQEDSFPVDLTGSETSWMISLLYLGNLASPIPTGLFMDYFGRRNTLLLLSPVPLTTWILTYFASTAYELYIARCLAGVWNGAASTVAPIYIAEISEARVRGTLSTCIQFSLDEGLLFAYVVGARTSHEVTALTFSSLPVIFVLCFGLIPESPYWLLMKNKKEAALKSLTWFRSKNENLVKRELLYMERAINEEMKEKHSFDQLFLNKGNRQAFIIVMVIAICQRMSGLSVIYAYTSYIFFRDKLDILSPNEWVIVVGCVLIISVIVASVLIDIMGRKPLLLISSIGCGLAMCSAGSYFYFSRETSFEMTKYKWILYASILGYAFMFSIGFGPVVSTIQGEMFPSYFKGLASGITAEVLSLCSLLSNVIYYLVEYHTGLYVNYCIFSLFCFFCSLFVIFYVVETKNKTLRQIQEQLNNQRISIRISHVHA